MKTKTLRNRAALSLLPLLISFCLSAQTPPVKQWDKTFGGNHIDNFSSLQQTSDGGYILGGYSYSRISGDKTAANKGDADYWIVKVDAAGNKQWDKALWRKRGGFSLFSTANK